MKVPQRISLDAEQLSSTTGQVIRLFHPETLAVSKLVFKVNGAKLATRFICWGMFYCGISRSAGRDRFMHLLSEK